MIVKMKKISVVLQDKDIHGALNAMGKLGVLHLEHFSSPKGEPLDLLREEHDRMANVLSALKQVAPRPPQEECDHVKQMFINAATSLAEIEEMDARIQDYTHEIARWEPWGDFDPHELVALGKHGIKAKLYAIPETSWEAFPDDFVVERIFTANGIAHVIVLSFEEIVLPFDEVVLPKFGLNQWQLLVEKEQQQRAELERFVQESARFIDVFEKRLKRVEGRLAYQVALSGRDVQDDFAVIQGYCPADQCAAFEDYAKQEEWAYLIQEPSDKDHVPTLMRNPKWMSLIQPVLKVVEIIPGYKEFDVSLVFLVFFTLFFGILIGDAAYGLIFAGVTFFVQKKAGHKIEDKTPFILMYLLTGFTVVWGLLTGTFFGQQWLPSSIKPLVPWLNDFENMQLLCFCIALVHLSIAKLWSIARKYPSITFLSDVGWLLIIWGMFFVANMFVLGFTLPTFVLPLFYIGIPLAFIFMVEPKNLLKVVGQEIVPFILGVVGAGTDIVSYIRLFAVGLATVAVADATNTMASGLPLPAMIIVLIIGHSLNLVLAAMAILVHAIRLNVLEFSGQLGMEWSGHQYRPFRKEV